jgi:hypothetical protein
VIVAEAREVKSEAKPRAVDRLKDFIVVLLQSMASGGDVSLLSLRKAESGQCWLVVLILSLYTQR